MPTYTVKFSNFNLSSKQKKKIVKGITKVHSQTTGANNYFAQVIFQKNNKGSHFMGGKEVKSKEIFLNGKIRSGRSSTVKKKLINGLKMTLLKNLSINKDNIWVYLEDLIPEQMIEYGETLPKSGEEKKWFTSLPASLRKKLKKIDN